jgi:hypothetical protein
MSTKTSSKQTSLRERGMVSIMVTMILMIVLSLIVIGFAQIARRNSRQSLDRQLSTSAFYAAEAGVNDVRDLITRFGVPPEKPDCTNGSGAAATYYSNLPSAVLDATANIRYTCVMVDPSLTTLPYTLGYTGTVVPLVAESGTINNLTFTWNKSTTSATPTSGCNGNLTSATTWTCGYAALRIDLVPTSGALNNGMSANTMSSWLIPVNSGGGTTAAFNTTGSNSRISTRCTNTNCTLTINSGLGGNSYYLRVMSQYYQNVEFQLSATNGAGSPVSLVGAQVLIDVTGKSQDVLRRVQVRVPADGSSQNLTSDFAVKTTDSICKRFDIMTNRYQSDAGNAVPTMDSSGNPFCRSP